MIADNKGTQALKHLQHDMVFIAGLPAMQARTLTVTAGNESMQALK